MKETPEDKALEDRMGASKFSGEGFLGTDHRTVDQIVADDLRNGAAMCAVQCAELLLNRGVFAEALAG